MAGDSEGIPLHLDRHTAERLHAWAEQQGLRGGLDAIALAALQAFLDEQPAQMEFRLAGLSPTEREVMQRTARGEQSVDIAAAMGLTENTVAQARYRALKKGAGGRERVTLGQMRERGFDRAASRVLGQRPYSSREAAFLQPPADVREGAIPTPPDQVLLGLPQGRPVGRAWQDDPRPFRAPKRERPLTGLTNRLGPTFWASTRLVMLAGEEGPVTPAQLLQAVMPDAWRIGAGLHAWEERQRESIQSRPGAKRRGVPFHFSARWPSASGPETREASSMVGFVTLSMGDWRGTGSAVSGPFFTLGLAEILPTQEKGEPLFIRPTTKALDLAVALGHAGASCWYPYGDAAWDAIRECLRTTPTGELDRAREALRLVAESEGTGEFQERIGRAFDIPPGSTGARRATEASGQLARLRELGLVTIPGASDLDLYRPVDGPQRGGAPFGPEAVTDRGHRLLLE